MGVLRMKRGQLSAEMLILLVIILALVAIVFTQLNKVGDKTAASIDAKTDQLTAAANYGPACSTDSDCDPLLYPKGCQSVGTTGKKYCQA